jgi:UDP-3-O-[3-hydroxymyristoyl] glucosamine N-acyltransferase
MPFTIAQIAERVRGEIQGDATSLLTGLAPADSARAGDLTFAEKDVYFQAALQSQATAILVSGISESSTTPAKPLIRVANARVAMAALLPLFFPPDEYAPGVDPSAHVALSAKVDSSAHVGPGCVIGPNVVIGARSVLMGGNHIGRDSKLGDDVHLYPNVVIYYLTQIGNRVTVHAGTVIGSDGYGYVFDQGLHQKILQVGNVIIHDDVEIGANAAIDRAALGSTVIGRGTKIDNLVHVAHNVMIGQHCLVMGQVGFAGSVNLGDYSVVASQSGIAGHLKLGRQSTIGAKSGVMRDIPDGGTVLGIPAMPDKQTKRQWIALQQLPDMLKEIRALQKEVHKISERVSATVS